jgi:hypothetical protein
MYLLPPPPPWALGFLYEAGPAFSLISSFISESIISRIILRNLDSSKFGTFFLYQSLNLFTFGSVSSVVNFFYKISVDAFLTLYI